MSDLFAGAEEIELYEDQEQIVELAREAVRDGDRNILICSPTGSGKTVIGSHLIKEAFMKGRRAAFVCDRITLIDQTSETFTRYGVDHGVIQADHPNCRPWHRVQVCSDATLARRGWPDADLIIIDEAHTVTKTVSERISKRDCVTLGLSATPFTRGLGKLYDRVINVTTTDELIKKGRLSPFRIFACVEPNMDGVKVVAGEWDETETSHRALQVVGDVVKEYLRIGEGRKFLVSSVDVAHAEELARQFNEVGVRAVAYSYRTPDEERRDYTREFRKPDSYIRGMISPVALTKGFDVSDVSYLAMARPLRSSLAEFIQFFGRGLRIHPGKADCIIADHSGNCARFWSDWRRFFAEGCLELDDGTRKKEKKTVDKDEATPIKCPQCSALHKPMPRCPVCGYERPKLSMVQAVPGTLTELIATGDRKMITTELWPQIVGAAQMRPYDNPTLREKWAIAKFKDLTGEWPKASYPGTKPVTPSPELMKRIKALDIRFFKGQEKARRAVG